jgi:hypothetical protein
VLEFVLNAYPGSEAELGDYDCNLLHYAVKDDDYAKVKFLTTEYPYLIQEYNHWGLTPLLHYLSDNENPKKRIISALIATDGMVVRQAGGVCEISDYVEMNNHLSLPLHLIVDSSNPLLSPISEMADILRYFIDIYPDAKNIKNIHEKYPYNYAVEKKLNSYFVRILLHGDPSINPTLLYDLNYAERRYIQIRVNCLMSAGSVCFYVEIYI